MVGGDGGNGTFVFAFGKVEWQQLLQVILQVIRVAQFGHVPLIFNWVRRLCSVAVDKLQPATEQLISKFINPPRCKAKQT